MVQNKLNKKKNIIFCFFSGVVLLFGFWFTPSAQISDQGYQEFDRYSNDIMVADLMYSQHYQNAGFFQNILSPNLLTKQNVDPIFHSFIIENEFVNNRTLPQNYFQPYTSSLTIHRFLYQFIDKALPISNSSLLNILEFMNCLLLSIFVTIFLFWIKNKTGFSVVYFLVIALAIIAPNFSIMGKNLYWAAWNLFLPMVAMIILISSKIFNKASPKNKYIALLIVAFASCFLKQAIYFEYFTTSMVAMMIPVFYYMFEKNDTKKFKVALFIYPLVGAVISFVAVFSLKTLLFSIQFGGFDNALNAVISNLDTRVFGNASSTGWMVAEASQASISHTISIMNEKIAFSIGSVFTISQYFLIIITFVITCIKLLPYFNKTKKISECNSLPLVVSVWVSLFAPYSWFIFAKPHTYVHSSLCLIIWFVPFTILATAFILDFLSDTAKKYLVLADFRRIPLIACICISFMLCVISPKSMISFNEWSENEKTLQEAYTNGSLLIENADAKVVYYDETLYYVQNNNSISKTIPYYIQIQSTTDNTMDEMSFFYEDRKLALAFWENYRVTIYDLPEYPISTITTGQFDEIGLIWNNTIPLQDYLKKPDAIEPANVSDANWQNGISKNGTVVLVPTDNLDYSYLKGKELILDNSNFVKIADVQIMSEWTHLILVNPIDLKYGFPNKIHLRD